MAAEQTNHATVDDYTKPAFLRRVRIRGYKSIEFCDVPLSPLTILVGRNAAGKSNLLDALGFISDLMDRRTTEAVNDRKGWRAIHCHTSDRGDIEFQVDCTFSSRGVQWSADYWFSLNISGENQIRIIHERLALNDGIRDIGYHSMDGDASWWGGEHYSFEGNLFSVLHTEDASNRLDHSQLVKRKRYDRLLLSVIGTQPYIDLADSLRASCVYNFLPSEIRQHQPMSSAPTLSRDGRNLARAIEGIREINSADVERLKDYLKLIVPDVHDFHKQTYGDYETLRFVMNSLGGQTPLEFDASSMSDGTLRVLASLVAAFQYSLPAGHPGFIGIEEPETALHPAAMRALVDALDEATQRTQIILTTHSADLLAGRDITPGQVLVVRNRDGKTLITPLDPASREIIEKELSSLADMQRRDQLDLDEVDLKRQAQLHLEGS